MRAQKIAIVEDEVLVARGIEGILTRAGFEVVGIADSADEARLLVAQSRPDLVLLDITLRTGNGIDLGRELSEQGVRFLYVSGIDDALDQDPHVHPAGFVVKPFSERQLLAAVKAAVRGTKRGSQDRAALQRIANVLVEVGLSAAPSSRPSVTRSSVPELSSLSSREWEVLRELLDNNRVPAIAKKLHISPATVRNHLKSIFAKVGVHSQQELLERIVPS
jgi:DNA-binding NarL/FixJ family response regulator